MTRGIARALALTLLAAVTVGGLSLAGSAFMVMFPAFLLLLPLLLGHYVGERRILSLRRAIASRRSRLTTASACAGLRPSCAAPIRGGRLIATSIAVRPPPLPAWLRLTERQTVLPTSAA